MIFIYFSIFELFSLFFEKDESKLKYNYDNEQGNDNTL
jgi:hypothetical protein